MVQFPGKMFRSSGRTLPLSGPDKSIRYADWSQGYLNLKPIHVGEQNVPKALALRMSRISPQHLRDRQIYVECGVVLEKVLSELANVATEV